MCMERAKLLTSRPLGGVATLLVVVAALVGACTPVAGTSPAPSATTPSIVAVDPMLRSVTGCRQLPVFTGQLELTDSAFFGTNVAGHTGLAIADPAANSVLQDDTWDDAGNLGPYVLDGLGNVWTAPVPLTSLELNPPEQQNTIYRVDTNTAKMVKYVELLPARPPSEFNPFGIVGLAYDCETNSLYAASLMGSTPTEEVGRVFRVDLDENTATIVLEGVDVMGVGVADTTEGKRLYYGLARSGEVRSLPLDANGDTAGTRGRSSHWERWPAAMPSIGRNGSQSIPTVIWRSKGSSLTTACAYQDKLCQPYMLFNLTRRQVSGSLFQLRSNLTC